MSTIDILLERLDKLQNDPVQFVEDFLRKLPPERTKGINVKNISTKMMGQVLVSIFNRMETHLAKLEGSDNMDMAKISKARGMLKTISTNFNELVSKSSPEFMEEHESKSMQDRLMDEFNLGNLNKEQFNARMQEMTAAARVGICRKASTGGYMQNHENVGSVISSLENIQNEINRAVDELKQHGLQINGDKDIAAISKMVVRMAFETADRCLADCEHSMWSATEVERGKIQELMKSLSSTYGVPIPEHKSMLEYNKIELSPYGERGQKVVEPATHATVPSTGMPTVPTEENVRNAMKGLKKALTYLKDKDLMISVIKQKDNTRQVTKQQAIMVLGKLKARFMEQAKLSFDMAKSLNMVNEAKELDDMLQEVSKISWGSEDGSSLGEKLSRALDPSGLSTSQYTSRLQEMTAAAWVGIGRKK